MLLIEEAFAREVARYVQRLGTARTEEVGRLSSCLFLATCKGRLPYAEGVNLYDMILVLICNIHCWNSIIYMSYVSHS